MKITSSSFVSSLALSSIACASYTDIQSKVSLDFAANGASCGAVQHAPGRKSSISFYIDTAIVEDNSVLKDLKIPFAVFRYTDIAQYEKLPILDTYTRGYGKSSESRAELYNGLVDFDSNKFIIERKNKDNNKASEKSSAYTNYLKYDEGKAQASYDVEESGIYCIYIAPPLDKGIKEISIPIRYVSSNGYLTPTEYKAYSSTKWFSLLGIFLFFYLFYYILRFKTDKDFTNMDDISLISKGVIFYVLFPIVCFQIMQIVFDGLKNNFSPSDKSSPVINFLLLFMYWAGSCFGVIVQYFIFLFSMGFGVIYYVRDSSKNYRKLPEGYQKRANVLLVSNIIIVTLEYLVTLFSDKSSNPFFDPILRGMLSQEVSQLSNPSTDFARGLLSFLGVVFSIIWSVYSIYHYFSTKKVIAKFPVIEDTDVLERITKSFRYSILIIFVLPFFVAMGGAAVLIFQSVSKSVDWNNLPPLDGPVDSAPLGLRLQSVMQFQFTEKFIFDNFTFESTFLSAYISIVCIYFIWIKDNNGLIIDKEDFTSIPSFADDEEN